LNSLPPREFRAGLAEVIKCGVIRDPELLTILEEEEPSRLGRSARLEEVVARALVVKARIVEEDERDQGLRRLLNFGHTAGHALESATGFRHYLHGEAVSLGAVVSARLSVLVAGLPESDARRLESLLTRYGLPVRTSVANLEAILGFLAMDKKVDTGGPMWVLTARLGTATVAGQVPEGAVRAAVSYILETPVVA
jgi:3-dehydroquinate synthetase